MNEVSEGDGVCRHIPRLSCHIFSYVRSSFSVKASYSVVFLFHLRVSEREQAEFLFDSDFFQTEIIFSFLWVEFLCKKRQTVLTY